MADVRQNQVHRLFYMLSSTYDELQTSTSQVFRGFAHVYGHLTIGGIDERMESTFPPVFSPNSVPRS